MKEISLRFVFFFFFFYFLLLFIVGIVQKSRLGPRAPLAQARTRQRTARTRQRTARRSTARTYHGRRRVRLGQSARTKPVCATFRLPQSIMARVVSDFDFSVVSDIASLQGLQFRFYTFNF
jgi:hypothetical protein